MLLAFSLVALDYNGWVSIDKIVKRVHSVRTTLAKSLLFYCTLKIDFQYLVVDLCLHGFF